MEAILSPFSNMLNNHTGTIYIFQEERTGNLLLKTTDISVLQKLALSQTIAKDEKVIIDNTVYKVVAFEIEISSFSPTLSTPHLMQIG